MTQQKPLPDLQCPQPPLQWRPGSVGPEDQLESAAEVPTVPQQDAAGPFNQTEPVPQPAAVSQQQLDRSSLLCLQLHVILSTWLPPAASATGFANSCESQSASSTPTH